MDFLLDLVTRNKEELKDLAFFADSILEDQMDNIIDHAKSAISDSEITLSLGVDDYDYYENEIDNWQVDHIEVSRKHMIGVSKDNVEYEIDFDVTITASYSIPCYDESPWDPEDKKYIFVFYNSFTKRYKETFSSYLEITYSDSIRANAEISEFSFDNNPLELDECNSELISRKENRKNDI